MSYVAVKMVEGRGNKDALPTSLAFYGEYKVLGMMWDGHKMG